MPRIAKEVMLLDPSRPRLSKFKCVCWFVNISFQSLTVHRVVLLPGCPWDLRILVSIRSKSLICFIYCSLTWPISPVEFVHFIGCQWPAAPRLRSTTCPWNPRSCFCILRATRIFSTQTEQREFINDILHLCQTFRLTLTTFEKNRCSHVCGVHSRELQECQGVLRTSCG